MTGRIIQTADCVAEGTAWLALREPELARALAATGQPPLRRSPEGFARLLHAIVGQQVSVASAEAVWARLATAGLDDPAGILAAADEDLRAAGMSRQKTRYARALASADLDYDGLRAMSDEEVIKTLTAVPGIGRWTAEIYAMFCLGRADVLAAGDLAVQEAARQLYDLPARPREKQMRTLALRWSPWRSVAARMLWAYYAYDKQREGIR